MVTNGTTAKSETKTRANGEQYVPATRRADGTMRKEIRVKQGYKSPDDVERYRNQTVAAWKDRGKGGVPGAELVDSPEKPASSRRRRPNKAKALGEEGKKGEEGHADGEAKATVADDEQLNKAVDPEEAKAKEARKLAKKVRQARELGEKKQNGEKLLPEQYQKVLQMNNLVVQLEKMGFNAEGEKQAGLPTAD